MIYLLNSDTENYSSFIENYPEGDSSIMNKVMAKHWKPLDNYEPITLELTASDTGKKNYHFDISESLNPFIVFSEKSLHSLSDILSSRGQLLKVITQSKSKDFFGFYPTNSILNCLDKKSSIYREYPGGLAIRKPVLIEDQISDEYLFTIEEDIRRIFVTEKFKNRVEEAGLLGFDFSVTIPTS